MGKGILLEAEGRQGIVLTPDGEFRRIPLPSGSRVGDEVAYAQTQPFPVWRWMAVAAAVVALAIIPLAATQMVFGSTVAVVALDINPSLEFDINDGGKVIRARALNADGEDVLRELSYRRAPVEVAVQQATDLSIRKGYLKPQDTESSVLVTVTALMGPTAESALDEVQTRAVSSVQDVLTRHSAKTQAYGLKATAEERQEAQELQVPVARYLLFRAAREVDPEVKLPEVVKIPPGQINKVVKKFDLKALLRIVTEQHDAKVKEDKAKAEKSKDEQSDKSQREKGGGLLKSLFPTRKDGQPESGGRSGNGASKDAPRKDAPSKAPGNETPGQSVPGKGGPGKDAPAPGKSAPGKSAPGKSAPGKSAPGKSAPGKDGSAPGKSPPGSDAPNNGEDRKDAPQKEAPGKDGARNDGQRRSGQGAERAPDGGMRIGIGIGNGPPEPGSGSGRGKSDAPGSGRAEDGLPGRGR